MNDQMVHRGPDDEGYYAAGEVGLAMRRLSIIDLDGGSQPITNEDGQVIAVQNGEIYNYRELRDELLSRGHIFTTASDTEVIVHGYEEWGRDLFSRLRGMFAIAIWDVPRQRLTVARDRFGIKPLYFHANADGLAFASELKCLLQLPDFPRDIDTWALHAYLTFGWIPAPRTIFDGVSKLPPGGLLTAEKGTVRVERFARTSPAPRRGLRRESIDELAAELRGRLRSSVGAHLIADVPVGVFLSGGVDSATLTALAAEQTSGSLKTFSIGFDDAEYSELDRARLVAERYGTDHVELVVEPDAADLLPKLARTFDEPFADSSALPTYLVSQLAAEHVKVALAGEGGDELFGGYYTYVANRIAPMLGPVASRMAPIVNRLPSSSGRFRLDDKAKRFAAGGGLPPLERHCAWTTVFSSEGRERLLSQTDGSGVDALALHRERYAETEGAVEFARAQDLDMGFYLVDDLLTKTDRVSMAHSLEVRVPFLDTEVTDLAMRLPTNMKVRGTTKKRLLRMAAEPLLPPEILSAPKQGFSIPAAGWLRDDLSPLLDDVLSPDTLRRQGFFDPDTVSALRDEHVQGRANRSRHLWTLLMFSLWFEEVQAPATVA